MAQVYQMSADTRDKEKIIGGILTVNQLLWILTGVGLYALFVFITYSLLYVFAFIIFLPFIALGLIVAFKKVNGIPLARYILLKIKYKTITKKYINKTKENEELNFSSVEGKI